MLGDLAHDVVQAADGRTGLDVIADQHPDLVFLDLSMPVMGGREVLAILRQDPDLAHTPVVVVTNTDVDDLARTVPGLRASLLPKSQLSAASIRHAVAQAMAAAPRKVVR
jgi:CheY-like chemotaxis protein